MKILRLISNEVFLTISETAGKNKRLFRSLKSLLLYKIKKY